MDAADPTTMVQLQALLWQLRADTERLIAEAGPTRLEIPGAMGAWTLKDALAHLSAWRWWSVARMEAAARDEAPSPPWGTDLDEANGDDIDPINQRFYEASRDLSVAAVLADSRATFDRLEAAFLALPEADLFTPGRFSWLRDDCAAAIVTSSAGHLYEEHDPDIRAFLDRTASR